MFSNLVYNIVFTTVNCYCISSWINFLLIVTLIFLCQMVLIGDRALFVDMMYLTH